MFATLTLRRSLIALAACAALAVACDDDDNEPTPDIGLSLVPASVNMSADGVGRSTAIVTRTVENVEDIDLSASGMPAGLTVTFVPELLPDGSYSARINLAAAETVAPGNYSVKIQAAGAGQDASSATLTVVIVEPGAGAFLVTGESGLLTVLSDRPASSVLQIQRTAPFTGAVSFAPLGLPPGVTAAFTPNHTTGASTTMTLTMAPGAEGGAHTFEVRATALGMPDQVLRMSMQGFVATVDAPVGDKFALTLVPTALTLTAGGPAGEALLNITRDAPFTDNLEIDVAGAPAGMNVEVDPDEDVSGNQATIEVTVGAGVAPGVYNVNIFVASTESWIYEVAILPVTVVAGT